MFDESVIFLSVLGVRPLEVLSWSAVATYFFCGFIPNANASWTFEDIFAAMPPPNGGYVTDYTAATKNLYLPSASYKLGML